jgi:hypothetical protein
MDNMNQWSNNALQRTRPSHHCCNRGVLWAGSLSLGRSAKEMKKIRGKKRRLNAFSRQLDDEVASFPSEGRSGCGYWHLHMPCAQSFIDHSPNPTRLRKDCVKAILKTTLRLRLVKPEDVDARVVCCLSWPSLWDSQIIVFFGNDYYDGFFDRNSPDQQWIERPSGWLVEFFNLDIPKGATEKVYLEKIQDADGESEAILSFIGDLKQ